MGFGLYALVFGAFPMVRVIQDGLDGARPWRGGIGGEATARRRDGEVLLEMGDNGEMGFGLYALVFGAFPMVRVIQDGLDGARLRQKIGGDIGRRNKGKMGGGLYALVFGVFPTVHVIQEGLDGARPGEVGIGGRTVDIKEYSRRL